MSIINVAIADDQHIVRDGISMLIDGFQNMKINQIASNGKELLELIKIAEDKPDVIILDIDMPIMNGYTTAIEINKILPTSKIIYLSSHVTPLYIEKAIQHHANGFISKSDNADNLQKAIYDVHSKGVYFNDLFNIKNLKEVYPRHSSTKEVLTKREIEVIIAICQDKDVQEIALEMGIRADSVYKSIKSIKQKIGVYNLTGIVLYAVKNDFI